MKLTREKKELIPEYKQRFIRASQSPHNPETFKEGVFAKKILDMYKIFSLGDIVITEEAKKLCKARGVPLPTAKVEFYPSPKKARERAMSLLLDPPINPLDVPSIFSLVENFWLCFYSFVGREITQSHLEHITTLEYLFEHSSLIIPLNGVCIVALKPVKAPHWGRGEGEWEYRLHNPDGPALEWPDGYEVYFLQGIHVPKWVVDRTNPEKVFTELKNAEQRRVAIYHFGVGALRDYFKKEVLDGELDDEYCLMALYFEGVKVGPWLQMKCPSTGRVYIEAVGDAGDSEFDPNIKTIEEAHMWRRERASLGLMNGLNINPSIKAY